MPVPSALPASMRTGTPGSRPPTDGPRLSASLGGNTEGLAFDGPGMREYNRTMRRPGSFQIRGVLASGSLSKCRV
jgi:hypothetical protein